MESPDNSRVSRSICTCIDLNRALLYTATMDRDDGSNGAKRNRATQSEVDRWANGVDSPCAAQAQPPPTSPERPPSSWCIDVLTESWCAPLHQAVPCAQRQNVVVAHQPAVGGYFTNQFTPARERKCRLRWSGGTACGRLAPARGQQRATGHAGSMLPHIVLQVVGALAISTTASADASSQRLTGT